MMKIICAWKHDSEGAWETDCGEMFWLEDGTPRENKFKFCCFCGCRLKQVEARP